MAYKKTGNSHTISGFKIEEVERVHEAYKLVAVMTFGKEAVIAAGNNPSEVRAGHEKVARNADVISSIELRDNSGVLETLWKPFWDWDHGYDTEVHMQEFFHVTPAEKLEGILSEGLEPRVGDRSSKLNEPEGIWLFTSLVACEDGLAGWLGEEFGDDVDLAILKVNIPDGIAKATPGAEFEARSKMKIPADCIRLHQLEPADRPQP